jgi:hypothetical protein
MEVVFLTTGNTAAALVDAEPYRPVEGTLVNDDQSSPLHSFPSP